MLALSLTEGFARAPLSFLTTPLPASNQNSLSPMIPALANSPRKSNHSRTYRTPGGGGVWSNQSLFSFLWPDHSPSLSPVDCQLSAVRCLLTPFTTSLTKKQGYPYLVLPITPRRASSLPPLPPPVAGHWSLATSSHILSPTR